MCSMVLDSDLKKVCFFLQHSFETATGQFNQVLGGSLIKCMAGNLKVLGPIHPGFMVKSLSRNPATLDLLGFWWKCLWARHSEPQPRTGYNWKLMNWKLMNMRAVAMVSVR